MKITFKSFLNEGLIKLPKELHKQLETEMLNSIMSFTKNKLTLLSKSLDKDKKIIDTSIEYFEEYIHDKYPNLIFKDLKVGQEKIFKKFDNLKVDQIPKEYQKLMQKDAAYIEWDFNDTKLKLHLNFDNKTLNKTNSAGQYDTDRNIIDVNLKPFKVFTWTLFLNTIEKYIVEKDKNAKTKQKAALQEILGRFNDLIIEFKGNLEHELTHYFQFKVLSRGNIDQIDDLVDGNKKLTHLYNLPGEDKYYNSQVEFDPQIKSVIATTIKWHERLQRKLGSLDWKPIARFMIGDISLEEMDKLLKIPDGTIRLSTVSPFFKSLKSYNKDQYKKAVKYYMLELEKRIND